jgi:hypothetical protein
MRRWRVRLEHHARKEKVLISLGTFLSARADVLERLMSLFALTTRQKRRYMWLLVPALSTCLPINSD